MTLLNRKDFQKSYLLKFGIIIFILFSAIGVGVDLFFDFDKSSRATRFNDLNVYQLIISGVFIAPILEEFAFRGSFTKNKYLKWISYTLILGTLIYSKNYFALPLLVAFAVFFELRHRKCFLDIAFLFNAFLFSVVHYKFDDLLNISSYPDVFGTMGIGLVFIWLVLNFGLWASIVLHFLLNGSFIFASIVVYENLDKKIQTVENKDFVMEYQAVSLFERQMSVDSNRNTFIKLKNGSVNQLFIFKCPDRTFKELYFGKFNITIKRKTNSVKAINCDDIQQLVEKSNMKELR